MEAGGESVSRVVAMLGSGRRGVGPGRWRGNRAGASSSVYTAEFEQEFALDTDRVLRRRFFWFCVFFGGLVGVAVVVAAVMLAVRGLPTTQAGLTWGRMVLAAWTDVLQAAACLTAAVWVKRVRMPRETVLRSSQWLVAVMGLADFASAMIVGAGGASPTFVFGGYHALACLVLPWTTAQALWAGLPALGMYTAMLVGAELVGGRSGGWTGVLTAPLVGVASLIPGLIITWLRHGLRQRKFQLGFLQQRYSDLRKDLVGAQHIHEGLFPSPRLSGPVRVRYEYRPMRQIGGDFVFIAPEHGPASERSAAQEPGACPLSCPVSCVLLDVTGHGIGAALTVNRLHGELQRLFAEQPEIEPRDVLCALNRYIHLTLASHSIYATGIVLRVEPGSDTVQYASAGHPPAFVLGCDGTMHELDSTGLVLGVSRGQDYVLEQRALRFVAGDRLIAYTDGAIEARNERGRMLGISGIRGVLAAAQREGLAEAAPGQQACDERARVIERVLLSVDGHRASPRDEDDVLVVEIERPVG